MQDQRQRAIPLEQVQLDGLSRVNRQARRPVTANDSRHAGEKGQDSLGSGGAEPRHQNLQRGAQQKRAWSNQDEGRGCHAFYVDGALYGGDVTFRTGRQSSTVLRYDIP